MKYNLVLKSLVTNADSKSLLIDYLDKKYTYKNREYWQNKIETGEILVNNCKAFSEYLLMPGDAVIYTVLDYYEEDLDCSYKIEFENHNIIVVSKPANLPVQATRRIYKQTLTQLLKADLNLPDIYPIHRLDRETGGLIVYLKNKFLTSPYKKEPIKILKEKYYLAVVRGIFEKEEEIIAIPLKEAADGIVNYKMVYDEKGKNAETHFYKLGDDGKSSLLLARLMTGRKHQIRAHAACLGFPILGDKLYSFESKYFLKRCDDNLREGDLKVLGANNHMLHAYCLILDLEKKSEVKLFSDYFSAEMREVLDKMDSWETKAKNIIKLNEKLGIKK